MNPIDQLKAVLCDPTGKCCIDGSDEDRAIIDRALQELAKPEQEPVAWQVMDKTDALREFSIKDIAQDWITTELLRGSSTVYWIRPLYTAPPRKPWVGLTDEERHAYTQSPFTEENYRAIEAKLKEKNHGSV
jgi:hypothetical protein